MRKCKHPCPGCGKTDYWGTKGTLCGDCKTDLKIGQEVNKARKLKASAPTGLFMVPWAYYALRYIKHSSGPDRHKLNGDRLVDAKTMFTWRFYELIKLLSEPAVGTDGQTLIAPNGHDSSRDASVRVTMRKDVAACLTALYDYIEEMVTCGYKEGRKEGENLLVRLASGEVSMKDFNQHSIKSGEDDDD